MLSGIIFARLCPKRTNNDAIKPIQSIMPGTLLVKRKTMACGPQEDFDCLKPQ